MQECVWAERNPGLSFWGYIERTHDLQRPLSVNCQALNIDTSKYNVLKCPLEADIDSVFLVGRSIPKQKSALGWALWLGKKKKSAPQQQLAAVLLLFVPLPNVTK